MSNFIKNQKQRFIIMIITFIMIITAMPNFILATNESVAEDKKAPEVIAHIKSGKRISSKDGLNFTIKDESYMTELIFQWDRNLPNSNTIAQSVPLREEDGKEFVQLIPTDGLSEGLHELSVAARDVHGNARWNDIPYYIVEGDVPEDYSDTTPPRFLLTAPNYPQPESVIDPGRKIKIGVSDENDIYAFVYKWVTERTTVPETGKIDYITGATIKYKPGNEIVIDAPTEEGEYWLQYFAIDGVNNYTLGQDVKYYIKDNEAPVLTLNGRENIDVPLNGNFIDEGANWTDNVDGSGIVYANETLDTSKVGPQRLSYTYTDKAGNSTTIYRTVTIVGTETTYELILPITKTYKYGEAIDLSGAYIKVTDKRGNITEVEATEDMFLGFDTTTLGNHEAVFEYEGIMEIYEYYVEDAVSKISIPVEFRPTKLEYEYKDEIDLTGGKIQVTMASGATKEVDLTEATVTRFDSTRIGSQLVMISYLGKNATFPITVDYRKIEITIPKHTSVYGEAEQTLTGSLTGGSFAEGDSFESLITLSREEGTEVGTYKIKAESSSDKYKITLAGEAIYEITQAVPQYEKVINLTANYGQTLNDIKNQLPTAENGTYTFEDDLGTKIETVGTITYKVTFTPNDTKNYQTVTGINTTVEVGKGAYVLPDNVSFVNDAIVYDGQEHTIEINNLPEGIVAAYTNNVLKNAGRYDVSVKFTLSEELSAKYSSIVPDTMNTTANKEVATVKKVDITAPVVKDNELDYTNAKLTVTMSDGKTKTVALIKDMVVLSEYDENSEEPQEVTGTVTYEGNKYTFTVTLNGKVETPVDNTNTTVEPDVSEDLDNNNNEQNNVTDNNETSDESTDLSNTASEAVASDEATSENNI